MLKQLKNFCFKCTRKNAIRIGNMTWSTLDSLNSIDFFRLKVAINQQNIASNLAPLIKIMKNDEEMSHFLNLISIFNELEHQRLICTSYDFRRNKRPSK